MDVKILHKIKEYIKKNEIYKNLSEKEVNKKLKEIIIITKEITKERAKEITKIE